MRVLAPAKVNLTLEVLGRRDDGFHEIRSVMQAVSLADSLTIEPADDGALTLRGGSSEAPPTDQNLVLRAARALREAAGAKGGAAITLDKRIPVGAGLGGGSSDAAATLAALNDLWGLGLSTGDLQAIAAGLGSDVPFFLTNGTALAEGRGERLTPLRSAAGLWLVLAKPAAGLSTAAVYQAFASSGPPPPGNQTSRLLATLASQDPALDAIGATFRNDLHEPARTLCPEVETVLASLRAEGAIAAQMSGSGSACFGLCRARSHAVAAAEAARRPGWWSAAAETVSLPLEVER